MWVEDEGFTQILPCQGPWVQCTWVSGETLLGHPRGTGLVIPAVPLWATHFQLFRGNIQGRSLIRRSCDQQCLIFSIVLLRQPVLKSRLAPACLGLASLCVSWGLCFHNCIIEVALMDASGWCGREKDVRHLDHFPTW